MENLLENNFDILAGELFSFPKNVDIPYIQPSIDSSNYDSGNGNVHNEMRNSGAINSFTNACGNKRLGTNKNYYNHYQQHCHIGHSRSDSILCDLRGSLGVNAMDSNFDGLKNVDVSIINRDGSFLDRNNSDTASAIEIVRGSFDEISVTDYNSNYDANPENFRCLDCPLDVDKCYRSVNKHESRDLNDICSYDEDSCVDINANELSSRGSVDGGFIGTIRDSYHNSSIGGLPLNNITDSHRLSGSSFLLDEDVNYSIDLDGKNSNNGSSVAQFNNIVPKSEGRSISTLCNTVKGHVSFHNSGSGNSGQFVPGFDGSKSGGRTYIERYDTLSTSEQMTKMGICGDGDIVNGYRSTRDDIPLQSPNQGGGVQHISSELQNGHNLPPPMGFNLERNKMISPEEVNVCDNHSIINITTGSSLSYSSASYMQKKITNCDIEGCSDGIIATNNSLNAQNIPSDNPISTSGAVTKRKIFDSSIDSGPNQRLTDSSSMRMTVANDVPQEIDNVYVHNSTVDDRIKNGGRSDYDAVEERNEGGFVHEFNNATRNNGVVSTKTLSQGNHDNNRSLSDHCNIEDDDIYPSIDHFVSGNLTQSQILSMLCGENFSNDKQSICSVGSGLSTSTGTNNADLKSRRLVARGSGELGSCDESQIPNICPVNGAYVKMGVGAVDTPPLTRRTVGDIGPGGMTTGNRGFISKYDTIPIEGTCGGVSSTCPSNLNPQFEANDTRDRTNGPFNRLMSRRGAACMLDGNYHESQGMMMEADFVDESRPYWDQRYGAFHNYCSDSMETNIGTVGFLDWKSQNCPILDRCEFTDDFDGGVLYNDNTTFIKEQQIRHKCYGQPHRTGSDAGKANTSAVTTNNVHKGNNKQPKQVKRRGGVSTGLDSFDIVRGTQDSNPCRRVAGALSRYIRAPFKEHVFKSDFNTNSSLGFKMGRNSDGGATGVNLNNALFQGGSAAYPQHYGRKTCPPNYLIQGHNVGSASSLYNGDMPNRRKPSFSNTILGSGAVSTGNTKYHGDYGNHCHLACCTNGKKGLDEINNQLSVPTASNDAGRKGQMCGHKGYGVLGSTNNCSFHNVKNNHPCSSSGTSGSVLAASGGGAGASNNGNYPTGAVKSNNCKSDTQNNDGLQSGLTPSSIAAMWAKAISKTGGRTGFNNRNNRNHGSNSSICGNDNGENVGSGSNNANSTSGDAKKQVGEVVTCARYSSFLRNNSGRLHWLRVLYHYLDTVEVGKVTYTGVEDDEKDRTKYMVAVDDIAIEAVSKSFDPSECAYWSEPEDGAFVHKNIRLAVAHKVGHRTTATPQNYVNQILTASLDHNVSVLLNTLRAIDDRVRWMSTVVCYKSDGGIKINFNKSGQNEAREGNFESSCTLGNGTTVDELNNINNETGGVVPNSAKNIPGRVFTVGVREAMRCLRHRKLKALIVAPDIEGDGVEGSLRHHVIHILLQAQELNIPTIFALNRHRIGRAMRKHMRMSVLGLLSIKGVEKQFQSISQTSNLLKKLYMFCVENNLPPTEETFKKLSSKINGMK